MAMLEMRQVLKNARKNRDDTWKWFVEMGNIDSNNMVERSYEGIKDAWLNQPCFVVGAGYDLREFIDTLGWEFLDGKHTIFGETVIGYEVVEKISKVPTGPRDKPLTDVVIKKLDIIEKKEGNVQKSLRTN